MKKLLMLAIVLALCSVAAPVLAQAGFSLSKTCSSSIVRAGDDATFGVVFSNVGTVNLTVTFDEDLACPTHIPAGTPVLVAAGESLDCQNSLPADTDPGPSTVDNVVNVVVTQTDTGETWGALASASCAIYGTASGAKWFDMNGDGVWGGGEIGASGWKIHFFKADPSGSYTFEGEVVTGSDGSFAYDEVEPGAQYAMCEVLEPTFVQTYPQVTLPAAGYVDCTQFGSGYGPIGYDMTLSSGESKPNNYFGNRIPADCVNSWGYWKNHNKYRNANGAHRDPAWVLVPGGGEDAQFFSNWADPPINTDALTWFEILLIPPKRGNAYVKLAQQFVAAYLNIAQGANAAVLGTTVVDAAALLSYYSNNGPEGAYPPAIPKGAANITSNDWEWARELAYQLDNFNRGVMFGGPLRCGDFR